MTNAFIQAFSKYFKIYILKCSIRCIKDIGNLNKNYSNTIKIIDSDRNILYQN